MATFALPNVKPRVREIGNVVGNMFNVKNIGGWRPTDPFPDHPSGLALDYMVYTDKAKGDAIAQYHIDNAAALGVKYLIWYRRDWNPQQGWTSYSGTSNPHTDHVHVTYLDGTTGAIPVGMGLSGGLAINNPADNLLASLPVLKELEEMATKLSNAGFWRRGGIMALGLLLLLVAASFVRRMGGG